MKDKRKRAAPTIDLTAKEVPPEPNEAAASPEAPPQEGVTEPDAAPQTPPPEETQPEPAREEPARPHGGGIFMAATSGGVAGAILVIAAIAALWFAGLLPLHSTSPDGALIANLEKQVQALQKRPPLAIDNQPLAALSQRVDKIESEIAKSPPSDKTVTARLAAADNAMKSLGVALAALNKRSDATAKQAAQAQASAQDAEKAVSDLRASVQNAAKQSPAIAPAQLDALQKRVAALEQSVKAAQAKIAETSVTDNAARLTLSALALRNAVTSGVPYRAELAQAKALGGNAKTLAPLEPFAASGLPKKDALAKELNALLPALRKAAGAKKAPKSFLARLEANAGNIVHFSPIGAPKGGKPTDVLARLEVDAAHADIAAARADLDKLPAAARAPAQGWIAKVTARQAALRAARQFASETARVLGKPAGAAAPGKS
jgi:hypothetical protein